MLARRCFIPDNAASRTRASEASVPHRRCVVRKSQTQQQQLVQEEVHVQNDREPAVTNQSTGCPFLSNLKPVPPPNLSQFDTFVTANRDGQLHPRLMDRVFNGQTVASGWSFGLYPTVYLGTLDALKEAVSYEGTGQVWQSWPQSVHQLMGEKSITVTSPERYRVLRQILQASLSNDQVDDYLPAVESICQEYLTSWEEAGKRGETVKAAQDVRRLIFKVLTTQVMELDLNPTEFEAMVRDFITLNAGLFVPVAINLWPTKYYFAVEARKRIVDRLKRKIVEVRAEMAADAASGNTKRYRSSLRCILAYRDAEGKAMTDQEVYDALIQLLFAGHETTASWVNNTLYWLGTRSQILDRVRAEQQQIIAKHGTSITAAALKDMTYTTAALNEVMRLQPIVTAVPRKALKDVAIAGHAIPAGTNLTLNLGRVMQHDPRWPADGSPDSNPLHPDNFNPDRFMSPEGQKQGAQVPFGLGGRTCAGMYLAIVEAKMFLALFARNYTYVADMKEGAPYLKSSLPIHVTRVSGK